MTARRVLACFLLLPLLPVAALALTPPALPVDRIVVGVLAGIVAAAWSGRLAYRATGSAIAAVLFAIATPAVALGAIAAAIAILFTIDCGGGYTGGAC